MSEHKRFGLQHQQYTVEKPDKKWIGTWTASAQPPYAEGISQRGFCNQTVRQIVYPHIGGSPLRLRLSNVFGQQPLVIGEVHVAHAAGNAATIPETDCPVLFHGKTSITIPPGDAVKSDAVNVHVAAEQELDISIYTPACSGPTTWHNWSRQTTYIASGNHTSDHAGQSFHNEENSWFWLDAIDVQVDVSRPGAIVTLGDSITDCGHSTLNANRRWPDFLARRWNRLPQDQQFSVLNAGISGNEILKQSADGGVRILDRLDRDVFSQSDVTGIILLAGINDVIHAPSASAAAIIKGMKHIVSRAHDEHLHIYGATLLPFKGHHAYTPEKETIREQVNQWIRDGHAFDGFIDFDKALRDHSHPQRIWDPYHAGDHLHPNDTGLEKMASIVSLG